MADTKSFAPVFKRLKQILKPYATRLVVTIDTPTAFHLDTQHVLPSKKPLFFGTARVDKAYVSFHLMPVYAFPDLLKNISPGLKKQMQGKSCFNFRTINESEMLELAR